MKLFSASKWIFPKFIFLATCVAALLIFRSDYAAFSWGKFTFSDYGKYTNTIWNCGHGHFFKYLVDYTYLSTHLSFTLALLGPFFLIWDNPFLLSFIQWMGLLTGGFILWRMAREGRCGENLTAAILFFYVANPFTQTVMLSEFHGVALYFCLIPWLYHCLSSHKKYVGLPFILLLGLREDTGWVIAPMLFYFGVKDRWRLGYLLAALAFLYSFFAISVLFPFFGGVGFLQRRGKVSDLIEFQVFKFHWEQWILRLKPLLWWGLSASFFLRKKGWIPLLLFPSSALAISLTSKLPPVYLLKYHYSVGIITCLTMAIIEALTQRLKVEPGSFHGLRYALFLVLVTLLWHHAAGFLPFGKSNNRIYSTLHPEGQNILQVVKHIPKEGLLLCQDDLAGFCANRKELMTWEYFDSRRYRPHVILVKLKSLGRYRKEYEALIQSGEFLVKYDHDGFIIWERVSPVPGPH
ncbi:MAG: DUF2079 domain-containing protein [Chlamydiae bacterium]|nr:DUF2079 domain-containing protein [Chlamydiota bacterium]MBI3277698.1 DUF2079 domain-containing protein [Chlamydiota bacterium]